MRRQFHYIFFVCTIIFTVVCGVLMTRVNVNADMTKYLPDDSQMKTGLNIVTEEFGASAQMMGGDVQAMFDSISSAEIDGMCALLKAYPDVDNVTYRYSADSAHTLFDLTVAKHVNQKALGKQISNRFGGNCVVETSQDGATPPMSVMIIAGVLIMLILFVMAQSWFEPVVILLSTGVAVVLNMGTNALLPSVSITTNFIGSMLQAVLSLDYCIILLNRYRQEQNEHTDRITAGIAVNKAIKASSSSILSSALTTVVGLLMLCFMRLKIGTDMGVVLAKGVVCSLICTFTVMPSLMLLFRRVINKTQKRVLVPNTAGLARFVTSHKVSMAIGAILLFFTSWHFSHQTTIFFSAEAESQIEEVFPSPNPIVLVYNTQDEDKIVPLVDSLVQDSNVQMVLSYPTLLSHPRTPGQTMKHLQSLMPLMASQMPASATTQAAPFLQPSAMDEMGEVVNLLYYMRANHGVETTMTFPDLARFLHTHCVNNPLMASFIDDDMRQQVELLQSMLLTEETSETTPFPSGEGRGEASLNPNSLNSKSLNSKSLNSKSLNSKSLNANSLNANSLNDTSDTLHITPSTLHNTPSPSGEGRGEASLNANSLNPNSLNDTSDTVHRTSPDTPLDSELSTLDSELSGEGRGEASLNANSLNPNSLNATSLNANSLNANSLNPNSLNDTSNIQHPTSNIVHRTSPDTPLDSELSTLDSELSGEGRGEASLNPNSLNDTSNIQHPTSNIVHRTSSDIPLIPFIERLNAKHTSTLTIEMQKLTDTVAIRLPMSINEMAFFIGSTPTQTRLVYGYAPGKKKLSPLEYVHLLTDDLFKRAGLQGLISLEQRTLLTNRARLMDLANVNAVLSPTEMNQLLHSFGIVDFTDDQLLAMLAKPASSKSEEPIVSASAEASAEQSLNPNSLNPNSLNANSLNANSLNPNSLNDTSNIQHPTSDIVHQTSNMQHPTSNIVHRTSSDLQAELFTELVFEGKHYAPAKMASKLSRLMKLSGVKSAPITAEQMSLLYTYYESVQHPCDTMRVGLDQLIAYVCDTLVADPRIAPMLPDSIRTQIKDVQNQLASGMGQLRKENHSLCVILTSLPPESKQTTDFVNSLSAQADAALAHDYYMLGESVMYVEMQAGFNHEMNVVTLLTILAIFLIVAITFRSIIVPTILVATVMTAVYVNVVVAGLVSGQMLYLAYLIVQAILMGATIDYGILFANYYRENRRTKTRREAAAAAYKGSIRTILTSGLIMVIAPGVMAALIDDVMISNIVSCLAVGAFMAIVLILTLVPAVLVALDRLVVYGKKNRFSAPKPTAPETPDK